MRSTFTNPDNGLIVGIDKSGNLDTLKTSSTAMTDYASKAVNEYLDGKEYSGARREKMALRLNAIMQPFVIQANKQYGERRDKLLVDSADRVYSEKYKSWLSGENRSNAGLTKEVVDAYMASQVYRGKSDDEVKMNGDRIAQGLAFDYAAGLVGKQETDAEVDNLSAALEENPQKLLEGNSWLRDHFSKGGAFTPEGISKLKGMVAKRKDENRAAQSDAVKRDLAIGESYALEIPDENGNYQHDRVANIEQSMQELHNDAFNFRDNPAAKLAAEAAWHKLDGMADSIESDNIAADMWREIRNQPEGATVDATKLDGLRKSYEGSPRKIRLFDTVATKVNGELAKGYKARHDEGLEMLKQSAVEMEVNDRWTPEQRQSAQSAFYGRLNAMRQSGTINADEFDSLRKRAGRSIDARTADAMRRFYTAFGVSAANLNDKGLPTRDAAEALTTGANAKMDYYLPTAAGQAEHANGSIKGSQLYELGNRFYTAITSNPEKFARDADADAYISYLKTGFMKGYHDEAIEGAARAAGDHVALIIQKGHVEDENREVEAEK